MKKQKQHAENPVKSLDLTIIIILYSLTRESIMLVYYIHTTEKNILLRLPEKIMLTMTMILSPDLPIFVMTRVFFDHYYINIIIIIYYTNTNYLVYKNPIRFFSTTVMSWKIKRAIPYHKFWFMFLLFHPRMRNLMRNLEWWIYLAFTSSFFHIGELRYSIHWGSR